MNSRFLFKQQSVSVEDRNYGVKVARRKFQVLKQMFAQEAKFQASFKNIKFIRGNYQTLLSINTLLSKFSSALKFKNYFELSSTIQR